MKPKTYLQQIKLYDILIKQKIAEKDELKKYDVSGVSYDAERVKTTPSGEAPQVRTVERIMEYEAEIAEAIERFIALKKKIIGQIQSMQKPEYVQLLYKRYVEYKRLEEIALEMNYSYNRVKHLHGEALLAFGRINLNK